MIKKMYQKLYYKYANMSDIAKATFWFFICNIFQKCISFLTTPIFTRLLSTDQYGVFVTYNSWMQILTIIVTFRLDYGIFNKGMSHFSEHKDEYAATMQGITTVITTICFIIYLIFRHYFNELTGLSTFISVAMFLELYATSAISYWSLRQRYDFKYKSVVFVTLSIAILNSVLGIFAVLLFNRTGQARILSAVLVQICFGIIIYIYNFKKGRTFLNFEYAKYAILFNIPLIPHYFASYILDQFDRIMIMKMVSYSAVGIYGLAYGSGFVIKIVTNSLNNTLIPWMYRQLENKNFSDIEKCVKSIIEFVSIGFMVYMALSPEIISVMGSKNYSEATYILPPVTASVFLIFMYELFANIEFYYNRNKMTMYIAIFGAVANIILNYIFIQIGGYVMAAYTTLICYIYFSIAHFIYMTRVVKKECGVNIFSFSMVIQNICIIVGFSIMILLCINSNIIRYIIIIMLLVYAFVRRKKLLSFMNVLK